MVNTPNKEHAQQHVRLSEDLYNLALRLRERTKNEPKKAQVKTSFIQLQEALSLTDSEIRYIKGVSRVGVDKAPSTNSHCIKLLLREEVIFLQYLHRYSDRPHDYCYSHSLFKEVLLDMHTKLNEMGLETANIENRWGLFSDSTKATVDTRRRTVRR